MALATQADVAALLGSLTADEQTRTDPLLDEASDLVIGYLGCDPTDPDTDEVPGPVVRVTARMVARVFSQARAGGSADSATAETNIAGPFQKVRSFGASTSGTPWLAASDKTKLKPYKCDADAYSINTAPSGCFHSDVCSANQYLNAPHWQAFCTCGADIAGEPIYGG